MAAAQGAVDSLLGRLTSVLLDEAQLLGGLRGDVEFIRDEMETMNGLLRHLTEAHHRNHLVRAWMKQVVGLARDCEGNVEPNLHRVGGPAADPHAGNCRLQYLRRLLRLLQSLPVRHRIATRIRELKVRARDVGDRRKRYGITVPEAAAAADVYDGEAEPPRTASSDEEDTRRRQVLLYRTEPPESWLRKEVHDVEVVNLRSRVVVQWLLRATSVERQRQAVRLLFITGRMAHTVADRVYNDRHPSLETLFSWAVWWNNPRCDAPGLPHHITQLVDHVRRNEPTDAFISKIHGHLKGQRFLILVTTDELNSWLDELVDAMLRAADGSLPGSAIIMITNERVWLPSPYESIKTSSPPSVQEFYDNQAVKLGTECSYHHAIFASCHTDDTFAMKTFLHLLYVNPKRTEDELQRYEKSISECRRLKRSIPKQMLLWCYNELPSKYRSCLLYLSVFPEGHVIRTTSLARRWVAEGLITASSTTSDEVGSSTDEAEHCLDVLFVRGFVSPLEISAEGNIKTCTVHGEVREFIARVATDVNFMDSNLPLHLARYLSIHNRIGLQKSHSDGDSTGIAAYLPALAASPQWQLLKVLDLEGCKGFNKKHMKSICKILLLKYLSLRNTDVTELPKQMKELQCLEALDIRQTKVPVLAKKAIVLPLLKHFLAGDKISVSNDAGKCEGSFSAVDMPLSIHKMNNLEILSHVGFTNSRSELTGISELLKLRKLGVALRGTSAKLSDLFCQIDKLHKCLRSLSVRLDQAAASENHGDLAAPKFIESLNISGLTSGLPHLIQQLHHLVKLTLTEAHLEEDGLRILGSLPGLRCLRLLHKSYIQSELSFKEKEFQGLHFLLVGTSDVTSITFSNRAGPKLERIIWSFPTTARVYGLSHLPKLREFVLNGDCNPDQVRREIEGHWKEPVFKHVQKQEDIPAQSAPSASAP